jgi:hypothetical protein
MKTLSRPVVVTPGITILALLAETIAFIGITDNSNAIVRSITIICWLFLNMANGRDGCGSSYVGSVSRLRTVFSV